MKIYEEIIEEVFRQMQEFYNDNRTPNRVYLSEEAYSIFMKGVPLYKGSSEYIEGCTRLSGLDVRVLGCYGIKVILEENIDNQKEGICRKD